QDLGAGCRVFQVPPLTNTDAAEFTLPAWMWNSSEWAAVAQAAPRAQRPLLQEALRNLRSNKQITLTIENRLRARCKSLKSYLWHRAGTGPSDIPSNKNYRHQLSRFIEDTRCSDSTPPGDIKTRAERTAASISQGSDSSKGTSGGRTSFFDFGENDLNVGDHR